MGYECCHSGTLRILRLTTVAIDSLCGCESTVERTAQAYANGLHRLEELEVPLDEQKLWACRRASCACVRPRACLFVRVRVCAFVVERRADALDVQAQPIPAFA